MSHSKQNFNNISMQEVSKTGMSALLRKAEEVGVLNLTRNNQVVGFILPQYASLEAVEAILGNLKRLHEIQRLSKENPLIKSDEMDIEYLRNVFLFMFNILNSGVNDYSDLDELVKIIFDAIETNYDKLFPGNPGEPAVIGLN